MGVDIGISRTWGYFLALMVGASMMFAGVGIWFVKADMDYGFAYANEKSDEPFPHAEDTTTYDTLSVHQKLMFKGALYDGKTYSIEHERGLPPSVIRYEGWYYRFDTYGYYDWLDPNTLVPTLIGLAGVVIMGDAARRDIRHRGV